MSKSTATTPAGSTITSWKRPDEVFKLQRLKQKQKALSARLNKNPQNVVSEVANFASVAGNSKRRNPFSRTTASPKKQKVQNHQPSEESSEDSIFRLLTAEPSGSATTAFESPSAEAPAHKEFKFEQILPIKAEVQPASDEQLGSAQLPIDWSLKSRLRFMCETNIAGNNLKTNQEASGLTSFVRCIDLKESSGSLDISFGARFYQNTHYWQHPHLPWLTLFPRNSKANQGFTVGEAESQSLIKEWTNSFRNLFQLVRARQCPYFYVCANTFIVLFRAAGVGGKCEMHALLSPTTRGMRGALKQGDIEYTMPFKKATENSLLNDSGTSSKSPNNSFGADTRDVEDVKEEDDEDMDDEAWLESLGVEAAEIKRISANHARKVAIKESEDDFSDQSLVLIEGVDCQAFYNFLLNCKSTTSKVGRLGGVPPTLLSPVAFQGATLKNLTLRSSKVRMDGQDFHSTELKGVILPHILPSISSLMAESKDLFSATMTTVPSTSCFCQASKKIVEDANKENVASSQADDVFGRENLSDCGLNPKIVEAMCRVSKDAVETMELLRYSKAGGGYIWE